MIYPKYDASCVNMKPIYTSEFFGVHSQLKTKSEHVDDLPSRCMYSNLDSYFPICNKFCSVFER